MTRLISHSCRSFKTFDKVIYNKIEMINYLLQVARSQ